MTIIEAATKGIDKIRLPEWNDGAYLKLHLLADGLCGPWGKLFDPYVKDEPTDVPLWGMGSDLWEVFEDARKRLQKCLGSV